MRRIVNIEVAARVDEAKAFLDARSLRDRRHAVWLIKRVESNTAADWLGRYSETSRHGSASSGLSPSSRHRNAHSSGAAFLMRLPYICRMRPPAARNRASASALMRATSVAALSTLLMRSTASPAQTTAVS